MAKAASPVRLQEELMKAATHTGRRFHRSAAEQVEYWAEIGRRVADEIDPDALLAVTAGLARVSVEPVHGEPLSPDEVFTSLEAERGAGTLSRGVTGAAVRYQVSLVRPGYLERVDRDGQVTVGRFREGEFVAAPEPGR